MKNFIDFFINIWRGLVDKEADLCISRFEFRLIFNQEISFIYQNCCGVFTSKINLHHLSGRILPFKYKELTKHITKQLILYFTKFRKIFLSRMFAKKKLKFFPATVPSLGKPPVRRHLQTLSLTTK